MFNRTDEIYSEGRAPVPVRMLSSSRAVDPFNLNKETEKSFNEDSEDWLTSPSNSSLGSYASQGRDHCHLNQCLPISWTKVLAPCWVLVASHDDQMSKLSLYNFIPDERNSPHDLSASSCTHPIAVAYFIAPIVHGEVGFEDDQTIIIAELRST